jgi:hypothetical protein
VRIARARHGVALIAVLWIIVLGAAAASATVARARQATALAGAVRARAVAKATAASGIALTAQRITDQLQRDRAADAQPDVLTGFLERPDTLALNDGRAVTIVVDPATRLDVNSATAGQLATLFAFFVDTRTAHGAAAAIRQRIEGDGTRSNPIHSLDELRDLPALPDTLLDVAAPYLTVDGDGRVSARAPLPVRRAAGGEIVDAPSRFLIISRGWHAGYPLTHEVQAVFARAMEQGRERLVLVRWRAREL